MNDVTMQRLADESELRNLIQAAPRALDDRDFDALGRDGSGFTSGTKAVK